ncbi:MAG: translation initiation factor [Elusimicrobiota bacterium]
MTSAPQPEPLRLSFARNAKGSGVTRVERLIMHPTLKDQLHAQLKRRLGCGGAVKAGALEFQGDHREALARELEARGYKVRRIG